MSVAGTIVCTVGGLVLVGAACRDVFDALFHPEGRAVLARGVMRGVWRMFRSGAGARPHAFSLAGPVALVVVAATWATLLTIGWALLFWPHLSDGFHAARGDVDGFPGALYVSLVTLTTFGFGDVTPAADWLRIVTPLESLLGFGLLSASISWLLLLYPVLLRRRALAYEVSLLRESGSDADSLLERLQPEGAERLYADLTSRLVTVERDLVAFPISYYFAERDPRFSMAVAAPLMLELAERGARDDMGTSVRLRAELLLAALHDFAQTTAAGFHGMRSDSTSHLLGAYAHDHLRDQGAALRF